MICSSQSSVLGSSLPVRLFFYHMADTVILPSPYITDF